MTCSPVSVSSLAVPDFWSHDIDRGDPRPNPADIVWCLSCEQEFDLNDEQCLCIRLMEDEALSEQMGES